MASFYTNGWTWWFSNGGGAIIDFGFAYGANLPPTWLNAGQKTNLSVTAVAQQFLNQKTIPKVEDDATIIWLMKTSQVISKTILELANCEKDMEIYGLNREQSYADNGKDLRVRIAAGLRLDLRNRI